MDADEASPFETSEMLATFLASTPLLLESWKLCSQANATAPWSFTTERIGSIVYVAFSGVQMAGGSDPSWGSFVALDTIGDVKLFSSRRNMEGEVPVMVHAGMLNIFWSLFHSFQNQVNSFLQKLFLLCMQPRNIRNFMQIKAAI
ncbi:hypothetical protein K1719_038372 [Acacia pycnantha]|nr:hypothetical protein K1719_038372 [Acacia pycnantha]